MTKRKRRAFDIDPPDELDVDGPETRSAGPRVRSPGEAPRRGPMASAIGENAEALRNRQAAEAAIREENDGLAHEFVRLKRLGLVTDLIPIDAVNAAKLKRDRRAGPDEELAELKRSIVETGLSNPIRVQDDGAGGFELVQGFRRLAAYRELLAETGEERWRTIPAGMVPAEETIESLYRRMVDENLIRKDISFAEMANLARTYARDSVGASGVDEAVRVLFQSADYQKRSYIRAFAALLERIDKYVEFPEAIPRNVGLALRARIKSDASALPALVSALQHLGRDRRLEDELAVLRRFAQAGERIEDPPPKAVRGGTGRQPKAARTVFRLRRPSGEAKCTVSSGRLEINGPEDFSAYERRRLEAAVEAFYRALEE